MALTISFGWWIVPALITLGTWLLAILMNSDGSGSSGMFPDIFALFSVVIYLVFWVMPSMLAWLIWALCTR